MAQAGFDHAFDRLDFACSSDRVGSGRSRTHDQMASVPRSQSFALVAYARSARYGQTTVTTASATHPTSAGRPCTRPWLRCTSAGLRVAPLLRRIRSLPRLWAPSSGLPPDRSRGSVSLHNPSLAPAWSGFFRQDHRQGHPVVLPRDEDRRHGSRSTQDGLGTYLT